MTAETDDVHATPDEIGTWVRMADEVLGVPATAIQRIGPIDRGASGTYAARRVWFQVEHRPDDSLRSTLIVAGDEPNEACPEIELEGRSWWPRATWGCEPCSEECDRHGVDWWWGVQAERFVPEDLVEECETCGGEGRRTKSRWQDPYTGGSQETTEECPACEGSGVVAVGEGST